MNQSISKRHYSLFFFAMVLICTICFAGCGGDSSNSSSTSSQTAPITPTGSLPTCLTVHPPTMVKLADGNYQLEDEIDNCGGEDAGPLTISAQIDAGTVQQRTNLTGLATIPAHGKATYHSFTRQTNGTNKELHFPAPSTSASVTISVMLDGALQGEWDGQVTIPAA